MGDKEGRGGELLVLPGEPELVATVPRQGVEVGEEGGLLHVLPQEGVEGGKGGPVPVVDVSRPAHFKTVHCALVVFDICEEVCVFLKRCLLTGSASQNRNIKFRYKRSL